MRRAFRSRAESLGYEGIDLDPIFFRHYATHGQRFEYPHDGHWNELAMRWPPRLCSGQTLSVA